MIDATSSVCHSSRLISPPPPGRRWLEIAYRDDARGTLAGPEALGDPGSDRDALGPQDREVRPRAPRGRLQGRA